MDIHIPFLSSTVTVSFWHFMRNLGATVSFASRLSAICSPNELHVCRVPLYVALVVVESLFLGSRRDAAAVTAASGGAPGNCG
jgi:hypothetical protein